MKPRNFAFVVGVAVLAAFIVVMLTPSCGAGTSDCPCPSMDGGADGEAPDWFEVHYAECVDMCDAVRKWGEHCDRPPMRADCVEWLWYRWIAPERCEFAATCYRALVVVDDCMDTWETDDNWSPPTFISGCPAEMP